MEDEQITDIVVADPNQLEMFSFKERIDPELAQALVEFQGKMGRVKKDGKGFAGKYATYDDIIEAFRDVGPECGITPYVSIYEDYMLCQILHKNGSLSPASKVKFPEEHSLGKGNDMQGFGSDITYLKRYIISAMLNIATGDDNGTLPGGEDTNGVVPKNKNKEPIVLDPESTKSKKVTTDNITELKNAMLSSEVMPELRTLWNNNSDFLKAVGKKYPDLLKDLENTFETREQLLKFK